MFSLVGTPKVYSLPCNEHSLQIEVSPNSNFFAVLTASSLSIWSSYPSKRLVGIFNRKSNEVQKYGDYVGFTWDNEGLYLAAFV